MIYTGLIGRARGGAGAAAAAAAAFDYSARPVYRGNLIGSEGGL